VNKAYVRFENGVAAETKYIQRLFIYYNKILILIAIYFIKTPEISLTEIGVSASSKLSVIMPNVQNK
jgi:hypothetical protein